jgi:hypothetical protein
MSLPNGLQVVECLNFLIDIWPKPICIVLSSNQGILKETRVSMLHLSHVKDL